jgi:hypothetical protein
MFHHRERNAQSGLAGAPARRLAYAAAFAACALSLSALAPSASGVAGYWKIEGKLAGHRIDLICRFELDGTTLSGPCFGDGALAKGEAQGEQARWAWTADGHELKFEAKLHGGNAMKGVIKTPILPGVDISGEFSAMRPVSDQAEANPPQGMDALRNVVHEFAHGRLKEERFTEKPAQSLRDKLDALHETYRSLGAIEHLTFVDRLAEPAEERATEVYELQFSKGRQVCSVDVTQETKIADLICKPI